MAVIPFGEYRPDVSDLNAQFTSAIANVLPRGDGYGPIKAYEDYTNALAAPCRGYFFARNADRSVSIFAGTDTKLYKLDNTTSTWTDVSVGGGSYSSLDSNRNWRFVQFNNYVFATQRNAVLQRFDLTSSSAFSNAPGSPPQAGYIAVVNRFLVLCDLLSNAYRIQWSGLNDTTNWTSGTNYSDYQDLPSGGVPLAIVGGELGVILQETEIRRMMYAAGSDVVFQIERIAEKIGIAAADAVTTAGNKIFFYSTCGFRSMTTDGAMSEIGVERVDRTVATGADLAKSQYFQAVADPSTSTVIFTYANSGGSGSQFDSILAYNYTLNRWSPINQTGQAVATMARPGLTLESLDALAPGAITVSGAANNGSGLVRLTVSSTSGWITGDVKTVSAVGGVTAANGTWTITVIDGTHIDLQGSTFAGIYTSGGVVGGSLDAITYSLDSVSTATLPALSIASTANKIGFFSGLPMEATLETPEQELEQGYRIDVNALRPVCDANTLYGSVKMRDTLASIAATSDESQIDGDGNCYFLVNTRLARGRIRIPSGSSWSYATGVEPNFRKAGRF